MKKTLTAIFLFFLSICFSQNKKIDSLFTLLKQDKNDTSQVNHFNKLCEELKKSGKTDTALYYANSALKLAKQLKFNKGIAIAYKNIGVIYITKAKYDKALENSLSAIKIYEGIANSTNKQEIWLGMDGLARVYNNTGIIYKLMGENDLALDQYKNSMKYCKELNDTSGIARLYVNMGSVFHELGNYAGAIENFFQALKIYEKKKDNEGIAAAYTNIGNIYVDQDEDTRSLESHLLALKASEKTNDKVYISRSYNNLGNTYKRLGNIDKALECFLKALEIDETIGRKNGAAQVKNNIGDVYLKKAELQQSPDSINKLREKALENYNESLKISEEIKDKHQIIDCYTDIGEIYFLQGNYDKAIECNLKVYDLSKKAGLKEDIQNACRDLSKAYAKKKNYQLAYEYHQKYMEQKDSIMNDEGKKKILDLQANYKYEQKEVLIKTEQEKERLLSAEETKKKNLIIGAVVVGLFLVMIFSVFLFRRFRISQKQKQIIEIQKKEVEQQKELVEEHQKDIIDSITYAKRLQQAILPSEEEIIKHLPNTFLFYKPKDIVAGDFYWMEYLDEITYIAAADSTGHGVPGAIVSVVCSNALNRAVKEFGLRDTGKILGKTRELVLETFAKSSKDVKDGMDISLLAFDKNKMKISWSGANNQLWYISSNELKEITADKQPIGKIETPKPFTTHAVEYKEGDIFYLMTDGYADQFGGPKGKKFKYKQLEEILLSNCNKSLEEQKEILEKSFVSWKGNLEQVDDVTIIGVKL